MAVSSYPIGSFTEIVNLNHVTARTLPNDAPEGYEYIVCDNLGLGQTVTITAPVAGGNTTTVSGSTGWSKRFLWTGQIYVTGI